MTNNESSMQDQRVVRSKERVLKETSRLLFEEGMNGVSVDEISRRSGVAKSTIYRHWPTRSALLLDACSKMGATETQPDTGNLKEDLSILIQRLAGQLNDAPWPSAVPSIIDAAERDPQVALLHATIHREHMQPFFQAIDSAKLRGEMAADQDLNMLVATLVGPLYYRRWFSKEPIDQTLLTFVVRHALS